MKQFLMWKGLWVSPCPVTLSARYAHLLNHSSSHVFLMGFLRSYSSLSYAHAAHNLIKLILSRIGATSFTQDQVLENCFTALNGIVSKLPNGLDTILMICMRGPGMPVLPVYQTLPHPPGASDVSKGSKGEIVSKIETGVCTRDRRTMEGSNNRPQDEEVAVYGHQQAFLIIYRSYGLASHVTDSIPLQNRVN